MDIKEKLVELLRNMPVPEIAVFGQRCGKAFVTAEFIADHLIANGVTVQEWISVKERLPKEYELVLVYRATGCEVENCINVEKGIWLDDNISDYPVTHWMPLPEPPKGE